MYSLLQTVLIEYFNKSIVLVNPLISVCISRLKFEFTLHFEVDRKNIRCNYLLCVLIIK